jgi:hypothetical protein
MANVFQQFAFIELSDLETLAEELEGTFLNIAYGPLGDDLPEIERRQKKYAEDYGPLMRTMGVVDSAAMNGPSGLGFALECISHAYFRFQNLLEDNSAAPLEEKVEAIRADAEEILYANLIFPDEATYADIYPTEPSE